MKLLVFLTFHFYFNAYYVGKFFCFQSEAKAGNDSETFPHEQTKKIEKITAEVHRLRLPT